MASTYSNIKIQLMATGENTTTWGDVTNVNLGTALEEAIVGSASVAFSNASVTLTLTDTNATQSARNMRLNLTGTATSGYNLVVPAIQKPYIINNGTDGTITVKNSSGSGTAVPAGKTMWVYNTGSNVVDAVTHLTSLTLGTALPVASGGTGSNAASGARTNLGATTVGANLFTLTNPSAITFPRINADNSVSTLAAGAFRTAIGSTTLGDNLFTITNPSAVTFPRFNADNTVSALDAATFRSAIGAGTSSTTGTVTSVGMTVPTFLSVSPASITSSGTFAVTLSGTALPIANGGTGSTSTTYCSLTTNVSGTLPIANGGTGSTSTTYCSLTTNVSGTLPVGNGGTGATTLTGILKGNGTSAFTAATAGSDYVAPGGALGTPSSGTLTNCTFPTLNQNTTGSAGSVANSVTFNNSGSGAGSGAVYNGSTAPTISYNTIGAYAASNPSGFTSNTGTVTSVSGTGSANGLSLSGTVTTSGNLTLSGSVTSVANNATVNGVAIGYRSIPRSTTSGTATTSDVGQCIAVTAGITIPNATFAAGDAISIYNNSGSSITITQGSGLTMYQVGTATTGNRTLAQRGVATIWFNSATDCVISGGGLS